MTGGKGKEACLDGSSCLEGSDTILTKATIAREDTGGFVRESLGS